jgi:hypothetical protein
MKTLTVICPAYNEEDVIASFYDETEDRAVRSVRVI